MPIVRWARSRYPTWAELEAQIGVPARTLQRIAAERVRRVSVPVAERVHAFFSVHQRPRSVVDTYDAPELPRLATTEEAEEMRRYWQAERRRRSRAGEPPPPIRVGMVLGRGGE